MDLYKKSVDESELALQIHIADANKPDSPVLSEQGLYELARIQMGRISNLPVILGLIFVGHTMLTNGDVLGLLFLHIGILLFFKDKREYIERRQDIEYRSIIPFYSKLTHLALPIIKGEVDNILSNAGDESEYSDVEIGIAIGELRNFFIQYGWSTEWDLVVQESPYIGFWSSYFKSGD